MPLYPVQNSYPDPFKIPAANRIARLGKETLYRSHTGFEAALADVDAERLTDTYAEAIIDTWNPWQIAYEHLPFLAWAMGVNLWESWWSEEFQRSWVARQWYLKSIRGTRAGLDEFVVAVGGSVKRATVPPARAYGTVRLTDEQRIAYIARFPQLRIYPFVDREKLPWLCYTAGKHYDGLGRLRRWGHNGTFTGPKWKIYPTVQNQGGNYTRTAKLYEPRTDTETQLTIRRIVRVITGEKAGWGFQPGVSQYDESVVLPMQRPAYFIGEPRKYIGANVYAGKKTPLRTISIGRSGPLELTQGKAQYQTVFPNDELLRVRPEYVAVKHRRRPSELYAGSPRASG
jgi:phage tail P2-like protein